MRDCRGARGLFENFARDGSPDGAGRVKGDRRSVTEPVGDLAGHHVPVWPETLRAVNARHLEICASPEWATYVEHELLPWVLDGHELGDNVVEFGPGPGLTTDVLLRLVPRLTAIELDEQLASALAARLADTGVEVISGDATATELPSAAFSAVTCFTMLHHVPTVEGQDRLFAEARRLLRPGGLFIGTDGLDTPERRDLHSDDIFLPVNPENLPARLAAAGLREMQVTVDGDRIRFAATAPR